MYTLYYSPGACSVATHVVLRELGQEVHTVNVQKDNEFKNLNPVGTVPVLIDGNRTLTEGAAIMLHLVNKHESDLFPSDKEAQQQAIQHIMFANATMHPAYGRLFFIHRHVEDEKLKQDLLNTAAKHINQLWQVVENQLIDKRFLGGKTPSVADIMLSVYARWGAFFPVDIVIGDNTQQMISAVQSMPNFIHVIEAEDALSD